MCCSPATTRPSPLGGRSNHVANHLQIGSGNLAATIDQVEFELLTFGQAFQTGAFDRGTNGLGTQLRRGKRGQVALKAAHGGAGGADDDDGVVCVAHVCCSNAVSAIFKARIRSNPASAVDPAPPVRRCCPLEG